MATSNHHHHRTAAEDHATEGQVTHVNVVEKEDDAWNLPFMQDDDDDDDDERDTPFPPSRNYDEADDAPELPQQIQHELPAPPLSATSQAMWDKLRREFGRVDSWHTMTTKNLTKHLLSFFQRFLKLLEEETKLTHHEASNSASMMWNDLHDAVLRQIDGWQTLLPAADLLLAAVGRRDTVLVEYFVSPHHCISPYTKKGNSELGLSSSSTSAAIHVAVQSQQVAMVQTFVDRFPVGKGINVTNKNGQTPLHMAVALPHWEIAHILLNHADIDVSVTDSTGSTVLHVAVHAGESYPQLQYNHRHRGLEDDLASRMNFIHRLVEEFSIDVNALCSGGGTALHRVLKNEGPLECAQYLLAQTRLDLQNLSDGDTSLHIAIDHHHWWNDLTPQLLAQLRTTSVLPEVLGMQNIKGETPLHAALLTYVFWRSDDHNRRPPELQPLLALIRQFLDCYDVSDGKCLLLQQTTYEEGDTVLHTAVGNDDLLPIVRRLVDEFFISVNVLNKNGETPLHKALWQGAPQCALYLVDHPKMELNHATYDNGITCFHQAVSQRARHWGFSFPGLVQRMLDHSDCPINALDHNGDAPLHLALAETDQVEMVETLLNHPHINVSLVCSLRETALHMAVQSNEWFECGILQRLVEEFGLNINACNINGETPLHLALYSNSYQCATYLLDCPEIQVVAPTSSEEEGHGETLLHRAFAGDPGCWWPVDVVYRLVVQHPEGCPINAQEPDAGNTVLHLACCWELALFAHIRVLLQHPHINLSLRNENGLTALDLATTNCPEICKSILLKELVQLSQSLHQVLDDWPEVAVPRDSQLQATETTATAIPAQDEVAAVTLEPVQHTYLGNGEYVKTRNNPALAVIENSSTAIFELEHYLNLVGKTLQIVMDWLPSSFDW